MPSLVAGFGDPEEEFSRYLALSSDHLILQMGKDNSLFSGPPLSPLENGISSRQHLMASSSAFTADGVQVASGKLDLGKR